MSPMRLKLWKISPTSRLRTRAFSAGERRSGAAESWQAASVDAKCDDRINARGTARGQQTRGERNDGQEHDDRDERRRTARRIDLHERPSEHAAQHPGPCETKRHAHREL